MEFEYQGVDDSGVAVAGRVEAVDRRSAVSALSDRGHFATSLATAGEEKKVTAKADVKVAHKRESGTGGGRINSKDILAMTGQLSTALRAGLPLLNCLKIIEGQQHKRAMKDMLADVSREVSSGESLSAAMGNRGNLFGRLYLAMIRVGETGGILEQTTTQLTGLLAREDKIKSNMKSAAMYPLILLTLGILSVVAAIVFILPGIVGTVTTTGSILPWPTRMLMGISEIVVSYWWIVAIFIAAGVWMFKKWLVTAEGELVWDGFKLRMPIMGGVQRSIAVGRFARTLGSLTGGGITILEALAVVRDTLGNEVLGRELDFVAEEVKSGAPLAEPLGRSGTFPPLLVQIVSVGEQTGKLDELLMEAAETFDGEADTAITRFMTVLPVALVLTMAVLIGFIVIATLLPIIGMDMGGAF